MDEQYGETTTHFVDIDLVELQNQLSSADELVSCALEALHAMQRARRAAETTVLDILDVALDQAWHDINSSCR